MQVNLKSMSLQHRNIRNHLVKLWIIKRSEKQHERDLLNFATDQEGKRKPINLRGGSLRIQIRSFLQPQNTRQFISYSELATKKLLFMTSKTSFIKHYIIRPIVMSHLHNSLHSLFLKCISYVIKSLLIWRSIKNL